MRILKGQGGFGFILVVMMAGIFGILVIGLAESYKYSAEGAANTSSAIDFTLLNDEIRVFSNASPTECAGLFQGNTIPFPPTPATSVPVVFAGGLQNRVAINQKYNSLTIQSIQVSNFSPIGATTLGPNTFSATLKVATQGAGGSLAKQRVADVPLYFDIDPAGKITTCSSPIVQLGMFNCQDFSAGGNYQAQVSCPADYPNALFGGCYVDQCTDHTGGIDVWIARNNLSGNTQNCMEGGQHHSWCSHGTQMHILASIRCCQ